MNCVLDCSSFIAALFPDEIDLEHSALLEEIERNGALVPRLWWSEVANSLLMGERRKRIDSKRRFAFMGYTCELPITTDTEFSFPQWYTTTNLATEHGLTIYDATYLELCQRRNLPLATRDKDLKKAAKQCGITLYVL